MNADNQKKLDTIKMQLETMKKLVAKELSKGKGVCFKLSLGNFFSYLEVN